MPEQIVFEDEEAPAPRGRHHGWLRRLVFSSVVVIVMLYVAALGISRTEGFSAFAMERLSAATGLEMTARQVSLSPGMVLHVADLRSGRTAASAGPGFQAARATLVLRLRPGPGWGKIVSCSAEDGWISFAKDVAGAWRPAALSGAASWLHAIEIPGLEALVPPGAAAPAPERTAPEPERREEDINVERLPSVAVALRNIDVSWWGAGSNRLAALHDVDLDVTPDALAGRKVVHVRFSAETFESERGGSVSPVTFECLWCGPRRLLLECALGAPRPPAGGVLSVATETPPGAAEPAMAPRK